MIFKYGPGGCLTSEIELPGLTERLDDLCALYYGGRYMIAESMSYSAAKRISEALGGIILSPPMPRHQERQLPPAPVVNWCSCLECTLRHNPEV